MSQPRVVAVIQARMGSTRLPAKVMRTIAGRPMIDHVVRRTRAIEGVDEVVIATSKKPAERMLVDHVARLEGVELFRGPEEDVLSRFYRAARQFEAEAVVRITGDCPLLSPRVGTRVVQAYRDRNCDYATNTLERTFPRGLDVAVASFEALERAHREAQTDEHREHVTVYIWSNPGLFELVGVTGDEDHSDHRWTVDTAEDLRLVRNIYGELYGDSRIFEYDEVLELLAERPEWMQINAGVRQKKV